MVVMAVVLVALVAGNPTEVDRIETLGSQIKCPVCQGESIANSPSQMARDMMALVEERVSQGRSDAEIIDEVLASYSGALLLDPPASGSTLILWLAPAAALALGIGVIAWWKRHPVTGSGGEAGSSSRRPTRVLIGGLLLVFAFAGVVVVASVFLQDREGPNSGVVADVDVQDLSDVSNETLEAVVAANLDNPQINGMRLALAERYYEVRDYSSAFPHYLAVADDDSASAGEAVTALVRLGWMAYDGNGEVDTAVDLMDQALDVDPDSTVALYLKGQILWCGAGDLETAEALFSQVLTSVSLTEVSRAQVSADLDAVQHGGSCT